MAGGQELLASQIAGDLGHKRVWNLGEKKEDDERVPFYLLLAQVMHRGAGIGAGRSGGWRSPWRTCQQRRRP